MASHPIEILAAILATLLQDDTKPQRVVPPSWMTPTPKGSTAIPWCPALRGRTTMLAAVHGITRKESPGVNRGTSPEGPYRQLRHQGALLAGSPTNG